MCLFLLIRDQQGRNMDNLLPQWNRSLPSSILRGYYVSDCLLDKYWTIMMINIDMDSVRNVESYRSHNRSSSSGMYIADT